MGQTGLQSSTVHSNIVLFDGVCNLCNRTVKFIIRHDKTGKIKFSQLQSGAGQKLFNAFSVSMHRTDSVVYIRDQKAYLRSAAALYILRDLGGLWKLSSVLFVIPRPIRDFIYDIIAKNRYKWFGKRESCMMPTPEVMQRFI